MIDAGSTRTPCGGASVVAGATALELWAGPECTVNRIGDRFRDQLEMTGFAQREDDLDRLASLGAKRLRFPILWERTAPAAADQFDWTWADKRLARLEQAQLPVIAGLVHHGSGPHYTNLLDPHFPEKLAAYARAVAERYPVIDAYTPVNEPLTTARFSGLYGYWYPHHRRASSFVRALLQQVRATVLAMREVRKVQPGARLVQTEDLGIVHSVPGLEDEAEFRNRRRWLTFDLLTGRVDRSHPLWRYLRRCGATEAELLALVEKPCPPDVVGINHYVTSDRFLDDRPWQTPSGSAPRSRRRRRFEDIESVRVRGEPAEGFAPRLREAWERYQLPVAITEAHLDCSREEQMRWLGEAWESARMLRGEGVDVRAVTAWAAFGAHDWNSLMMEEAGHYESGLWDVRGGVPRETALASLARQLASGGEQNHPGAAGPGWWRRSIRIGHPAHGEVLDAPVADSTPLLIIGATGTLGRAFGRLCHLRGLAHRTLVREQLDIADPRSVQSAIEHWKPWAIVNTAGFVRVDEAEHHPNQWRENAIGPAVLAEATARAGIRLVTFSSDLVFDGCKRVPYLESDATGPLNAYGRAKLEAERSVEARAPDALVIRTTTFFGPWDRFNFVSAVLETLRRGERFRAACDQVVSPTYVPDLVNATLNLLLDGESGLWHVANSGPVSWSDFAAMAAAAAGLDADAITPVEGQSLGQAAARPSFAALASERGLPMPSVPDALLRYFHQPQA
ncbi:MAG: sugar nucleotide-binding protein [Pseudomonadota bacterium]|nr:sugar nucleotide-binding protein [Pseudomonadota bacterium]